MCDYFSYLLIVCTRTRVPTHMYMCECMYVFVWIVCDVYNVYL